MKNEKKERVFSTDKSLKKIKTTDLLTIMTKNNYSKNNLIKIKFPKLNFSRNKNNNIFNIKKFPYITERIFKTLTSKEMQGNYNYEIKTLNQNYYSDEEEVLNKNIFKEKLNYSKKKEMFITNKNIKPYSFRSLSTEITNNTKHSSIEKNKNQKHKKLKNLKSLIIKNNNMKKFNRFSLVDKLMLKLSNPEDCYEEYFLENKPRDKYIAFKKNLNKKMNQIYYMLYDVELEKTKSMRELKIFNVNLQRKNYILKTREINKKKLLKSQI